MATLIFFAVHWQLSVFFQSFFQHRYCAHRQYEMSKGTEKVVHFLAWFVGGSSYLEPRAYAILHRMHHAYSDTDKDPHSPVVTPNLFKMMWKTKVIYSGLRQGTFPEEERFTSDIPFWKLLDKTLAGWSTTIAWSLVYAGIYYLLGATWWMYVFILPLHIGLGPIHGAIVNWAGHRIGYRNFKSTDDSRNTLVFDVLTMGELFQNNHHKFGMSPNFGARAWEIDPTFHIMRVLGALRIIDMSKAQIIPRTATRDPRYNPERPALPQVIEPAE